MSLSGADQYSLETDSCNESKNFWLPGGQCSLGLPASLTYNLFFSQLPTWK